MLFAFDFCLMFAVCVAFCVMPFAFAFALVAFCCLLVVCVGAFLSLCLFVHANITNTFPEKKSVGDVCVLRAGFSCLCYLRFALFAFM